MTMSNRLDVLDSQALKIKEIDLREKMAVMNASFESKIKPENGVFGLQTIDKGNGVEVRQYKNELNQIVKDFYQNGKLDKTFVALGDGKTSTTYYDDFGTDYKTVYRTAGKTVTDKVVKLKPNAEIHKGNFTCITDDLGRPIYNEIKDLKVRLNRACGDLFEFCT